MWELYSTQIHHIVANIAYCRKNVDTFQRQINKSSKTDPRTWDKTKHVTQIHDDLSHQSFTFHVKK